MKAMLITPAVSSPDLRHSAPAATPRLTSMIGNRATREAVIDTSAAIRSPLPPGIRLQLKLSNGRVSGRPQGHPARAHADGTRANEDIHAAALRGIATSSSPLPFVGRIQPLFGQHDISGIHAHIGPDAVVSADAMAAGAYAIGNHVVLGGLSDLHTVAHEATHVVQQRGGVQLPGGVGSAGDAYERHADAVADAVVAGRSATPLLDALPAGGVPGPAIQRVGGPKFGIKREDDEASTEGLQWLKQVYASYRDEVKQQKAAVIAEFQQSGKMDQEDVQTAYTHKLMEAEMDIEKLSERLRASDFGVDRIAQRFDVRYKGVKVATILTDDNAYEEVEEGNDEQAAIFRKHTLDGPSQTEYVRVHESMIRRFAYRGITPPERKDYTEGKPLTPINAHEPRTGLMGYNFNPKTGQATERRRDEATGKVTDLEWLNRAARSNLDTIPNDPMLLAFLQARKGAGRVFSVTSTPRSITSNHGASFGDFGSIKIDLASVPEGAILHSYKGQRFDATRISNNLGVATSNGLQDTTERGNESIVRNREILLSEIPNRAVVELRDGPERSSYEKKFRELYAVAYVEHYAKMLQGAGLDELAREPNEIRMVQDHFSELQAKRDFRPEEARKAAAGDVQRRLDYAKAYREAYETQYIEAYLDVATTKWWEENPESNDEPQIARPEVPQPAIPLGAVDSKPGSQDGARAGRAAGETAGADHDFNPSSNKTRENTTDEDRVGKKERIRKNLRRK